MKKINCPACNKELIRLEPYKVGIYKYWCDDCNLDITLEGRCDVKSTKNKFKSEPYVSIINKLDRSIRYKYFTGFKKRLSYVDEYTYLGYSEEWHTIGDITPFEMKMVRYINIYIYENKILIKTIENHWTYKEPIVFESEYNINTDIDYIIYILICKLHNPWLGKKFCREIGKEFKNEENVLS